MLIVLKIGGSAISDKKTGKSFIKETMERAAKEIPKGSSIIIIHGAGALGHSFAREHRLKMLEGNHNDWAKLRQIVEQQITMPLLLSLVNAGHAPMHIPAASMIKTSEGKITRSDYAPVSEYLQKGFMPVLHADAPLDDKLGLSILSGDTIATDISNALDADMLIYGTDVDGIYGKDMKTINRIGKKAASRLDFWNVNDVSGGMKKKVEEALLLKEAKVRVINLRKDGNLRKAIEGADVGTLIE